MYSRKYNSSSESLFFIKDKNFYKYFDLSSIEDIQISSGLFYEIEMYKYISKINCINFLKHKQIDTENNEIAIVLPYIGRNKHDKTTFFDWYIKNPKLIKEEAENIMTQMYIILYLLEKYLISHNDMKLDNILFEYYPDYTTYSYDNISFQTKFIVYIYDWDISYCPLLGDNYRISNKDYYLNDFLLENRFIPNTDFRYFLLQLKNTDTFNYFKKHTDNLSVFKGIQMCKDLIQDKMYFVSTPYDIFGKYKFYENQLMFIPNERFSYPTKVLKTISTIIEEYKLQTHVITPTIEYTKFVKKQINFDIRKYSWESIFYFNCIEDVSEQAIISIDYVLTNNNEFIDDIEYVYRLLPIINSTRIRKSPLKYLKIYMKTYPEITKNIVINFMNLYKNIPDAYENPRLFVQICISLIYDIEFDIPKQELIKFKKYLNY